MSKISKIGSQPLIATKENQIEKYFVTFLLFDMNISLALLLLNQTTFSPYIYL